MDSGIVKIVVVLVVLGLLKPVLRLLLCVIGRLVFRRFLESVGEKAVAEQPDRIHLTPMEEAKENPDVAPMAAPLAAHGFQEAGCYKIEEMPGVVARFWVQPEQRVVACICEHPVAKTWIDLVSSYPDDTSVTYSTSRPTGLEPRPGNRKVNAPELGTEALYQRLLRERPAGEPEEWTAENAARKFEEAYAREIAWRKNKGVSAVEVARQVPSALATTSCASSD